MLAMLARYICLNLITFHSLYHSSHVSQVYVYKQTWSPFILCIIIHSLSSSSALLIRSPSSLLTTSLFIWANIVSLLILPNTCSHWQPATSSELMSSHCSSSPTHAQSLSLTQLFLCKPHSWCSTHVLCALMECNTLLQQFASILQFVIEVSPRFRQRVGHGTMHIRLWAVCVCISVGTAEKLADLPFFGLKHNKNLNCSFPAKKNTEYQLSLSLSLSFWEWVGGGFASSSSPITSLPPPPSSHLQNFPLFTTHH